MILTFLHYLFVAVFVLFFFGFCIFIHELGHFLAAKWRKMHIVAFSIGFKKIWSYKHKGIEYRIGCLPFGGYVDIPQLESSDVIKDKFGRILPPITPINRIIVAFAGPLFNILFGFVLATFLWIHGVPEPTPRMSTIEVAEVIPNSPEYNAGLRVGDNIVRINDDKFYESWNKVFQEIIFTTGDVKLGVLQKNGKIKDVKYIPVVNNITPEGKAYAKEGLPYPFFSPAIPIIVQVDKKSEAQKIGLINGDQIIQVDDYKPLDFMTFLEYIAYTDGENVSLTVLRKGKTFVIKNVTPKAYDDELKRYMIGVSLDCKNNKVYLKKIEKKSAASKAGIKKGDIIESVNNKPIKEPVDLIKIINEKKNTPLKIIIDRNGRTIEKTITPILKVQRLFYLPGISVAFYNHINPIEQFTNVIMMSYNSIKGIFSKSSKIKAKHLSGPIGIISLIGKVVYMGMFIQALNVVTIITFCLALMNLLPLPILDGGHILISLIEIVIRRHLPSKLMQPICMFFAILLIALMLFATFNDVNRLIDFKKIFSFGKKETKEKPILEPKIKSNDSAKIPQQKSSP
jgi:regulator of sigma E protease